MDEQARTADQSIEPMTDVLCVLCTEEELARKDGVGYS